MLRLKSVYTWQPVCITTRARDTLSFEVYQQGTLKIQYWGHIEITEYILHPKYHVRTDQTGRKYKKCVRKMKEEGPCVLMDFFKEEMRLLWQRSPLLSFPLLKQTIFTILWEKSGNGSESAHKSQHELVLNGTVTDPLEVHHHLKQCVLHSSKDTPCTLQ